MAQIIVRLTIAIGFNLILSYRCDSSLIPRCRRPLKPSGHGSAKKKGAIHLQDWAAPFFKANPVGVAQKAYAA